MADSNERLGPGTEDLLQSVTSSGGVNKTQFTDYSAYSSIYAADFQGTKCHAICRQLKRRKPIVQENRGLKKVLSFMNLYLINVGGTVGAIFTVIGLACKYAGPALVVSYIVSGLSALFTSLPYCEFAARISDSGAAYSFIYASFGEFLGFMVGHVLTLYFAVSGAAVSRGWSSFVEYILQDICGLNIPLVFYNYQINEAFNICIFSLIILIGYTILMLYGVKDSAIVNNVASIITVINIIFVVCCGIFFLNSDYYENFFQKGVNGIFKATGITFFSYIGFCDSSCFIEEAKNPKRDMPLSIIMSLVTAASIYCFAACILVGIATPEELGSDTGVLTAYTNLGVRWIAIIAAFGTLIGLTASTTSALLSQPRIYYIMSEDGLLFKWCKKIHEKYQVPRYSIVSTCVIASIVALFINLENLSQTISLGSLLTYGIVDSGVVMMRFTYPGAPKFAPYAILIYMISCLALGFCVQEGLPYIVMGIFLGIAASMMVVLATYKQVKENLTFTCPWVPFFPLMGTGINFFMCGTLKYLAWIMFAVFMVVGAILYFVYGIRYSKLNQLAKGVYVPDNDNTSFASAGENDINSSNLVSKETN